MLTKYGSPLVIAIDESSHTREQCNGRGTSILDKTSGTWLSGQSSTMSVKIAVDTAWHNATD